jgi:hypothetical protein
MANALAAISGELIRAVFPLARKAERGGLDKIFRKRYVRVTIIVLPLEAHLRFVVS